MAMEYLYRLPRFTDQGAAAYRPGLERMEMLLQAMGNPHRACPAVHVAGTNGKGSTASMIAAIGTAAGRRIGLHTSPHLFHVAERMRIDGVPAPQGWLDHAVALHREVFDAVQPSFFEATVALSFLCFAEAGVDLVVAEVGMGGRLDATNVLQPLLAVITNIGLDHTDFLGATPAQIAREKAGIIKAGTPVITAADQPDVLGVLDETASRLAAPLLRVQDETSVARLEATLEGLVLDLTTPLRRYDGLAVDLPGRHQATNACLAVRAAELVFQDVVRSPAAVYAGLAEVRKRSGLRGRLDVLHRRPCVVADVAHNPDGLAMALAFTRQMLGPGGRLRVVFGAMRDKDLAGMARLLAEADAVVTPVDIASDRAFSAVELSRELARYSVAITPAHPVPESLAHFLATAPPSDALLITGSHQVVSQLPESRFASPMAKIR